MSVWSSIGGAVFVGLSVAGLVISWFTWRKKGAVRGMRAVAWSLLPLAAYLTNTVLLSDRIASAIARFSGSFVFSAKTWTGVAVAGAAAALFLVSGGLPLLNWRKARERRRRASADSGGADSGRSDLAGAGAGGAGAGRTGGRGDVGRSRSAQVGAGAGAYGDLSGVGQAGGAQPTGALSRRKSSAQNRPADDDMSDVEDILRRHGIK